MATVALDRCGGRSAPEGEAGFRRYTGDQEVGPRQQFLARLGQPARDPRAHLEHGQSGDERAWPARSPDSELIYIAVSITKNCSYCIHSHTAAARAKGMTDAQYSDFLAVVGIASQTNALVTGLQLPVDAAFLIES